MRLPRMTTRRWMIVVAVGASVSAGITFPNRWSLRQKARSHASKEAYAEEMVRVCAFQAECLQGDDPPSARRLNLSAAVYARRTAYHAQLRAKYEQAAVYPWLPIAPDPPEPE
jgi:hypothetical protein